MKVLPLLIAVGIAAIGCPAVADPTPSVGWSSPPIVAYVVPGFPQQQRAEIIIRAQRNEERNVSLIPSAELLPYVSALSPTDVDAPSSTDQVATITFTASLPRKTPPGKTVAGSIDVLFADKSNGHIWERWSLPVSIRAIGIAAPPSWRLSRVEPDNPQAAEPSSGLEITSPSGSVLALFPSSGVPGFGSGPEVTEVDSIIDIDGLRADRKDYLDPGSGVLLFAIISIAPTPAYPHFEILLRPAHVDSDDDAMLEHLLATLDLGAPEEDCSNGLDDDHDGKADCRDGECTKEPFCHGGSCNGFGKVDHLQVSKVKHCVSGGALQILAFSPGGQEFIPSSTSIVAIELLLATFNPPYTDDLSVRIREGSITGAILGTSSTETVYHPPAFNRSDIFWQRFVFPVPVYVLPGEKYVYEVVAMNASFGQHYIQTATVNSDGTFSYGSCDYPGGVMISTGYPQLALDQNFVTCASR